MKWFERLVDAFATEHFPDYDPDRLPSLLLLCDFDYGAPSGLPTLVTHYGNQALARPLALAPFSDPILGRRPERVTSDKDFVYEY